MTDIPFKLLIHFESIFAYGVWQASNFILLHVDTQLSQHHLLKRLLFPHWMVLADGSTTQSDLKMQGSTYKNCNGFLSFFLRKRNVDLCIHVELQRDTMNQNNFEKKE